MQPKRCGYKGCALSRQLKSRTQDANDPDFGKLVFSKSYEDFLKNKEAYKNS